MDSPIIRIMHALGRLLHGNSSLTLQGLQNRYEQELIPNTYIYQITEGKSKPKKLILKFEEGNFCHLFSISSIVKDVTPDIDEFSGWKGWNNILEGRITFDTLRRMNPQQFQYYHREHLMFDEFKQTLEEPEMIRYVPEKNAGSKLQADYILYHNFGNSTVHIGISQDQDGSWFARSYFVRDISKEKEYPTRYIHGMPKVKVKTRVSSKKA